MTQVRNKKEMIHGARKESKNVHFASLMNFCHLKNSELERGDVVKDDSGSCAVVPEQGWFISITNDGRKSNGCHSKATRMRRTSSRRSISLHPGQTGRCTIGIENSNSKVRMCGYLFQNTKWPISWSSMEDPVVPLERNLYGHLLAGLLWERQFEKIPLQHGWEKVSNWECLFVHREKRVILISVCG